MPHIIAMLGDLPLRLSKTFSDHEICPLLTKDPLMTENQQILHENRSYQLSQVLSFLKFW